MPEATKSSAMSPIHLLIPMAGLGERFRREGYTDPKPMIKVSGTPMIQRLLERFPSHWPCTFVLSEHHAATALPGLLKELRPDCQIVYLHDAEIAGSPLRGPARSALAGLKVIPADHRVFLSYCDYDMVWDHTQFERFVRGNDCTACLVSYRGFHAHYLTPLMYAYAQLDGELVKAVREKGCFTANREQEYASAGGYYVRSAALLRAALDYQAEHDLQVNGEHYISLTIESILRSKVEAQVRVFEIPLFCQWGTPADLRSYSYWEKTFVAWNRLQASAGTYEVEQVLMPMAGLGSRFTQVTTVPKPFIQVADRPMFVQALASLPRASTNVLVCLDQHRSIVESSLNLLPSRIARPQVKWLMQTPQGQALSTEQGLQLLNPSHAVMVSACDHEIVLDPATWARFKADPRCDGAIFIVRGYPGVQRRPQAYAYVDADFDGEEFPLVRAVSVKLPLSAKPEADALLVGSFWFASAEILRRGIEALKVKDARVKGELYLDSIFAQLQLLGHKVRVIPLDGYIGRGTPDELAESLYYQELIGGRRPTPRLRYSLGDQDSHA